MNKNFCSFRYSDNFISSKIDEIRINKVLKLIGKNKHVLDLGCWDGSIMERIQAHGNQVTGIEISKSAIEKAKKKGLEIFDLSLGMDWAKKVNKKFDVVFAGEIIEHIFDTDRFLQNIRKVLKKNGSLIITTPNVASLGRRLLLLIGKNPILETTARKHAAGHIRYFTFETLTKLLIENNFRIETTESIVVNFNTSSTLFSVTLARLFPSLGSHLIVKAIK